MSLLHKLRSRSLREVEADLAYRVRTWTKPRIVEILGVKVSPRSPLISDKLRRQLYRGAYELSELQLVSRYIEPDDLVLEIGAGLGAVSAFCAKRIGSDRVACVEANPTLAPLIRETHALNGVSPKLTIAIADRHEGEGAFFIDKNFNASSTSQRSSEATRITLPTVSMEALLDLHKPTFLIVDVEGYEQKLFSGLKLDGVNKIAMELHPHIIGDAACSSIINSLYSQGFIMNIDEASNRSFFFTRSFNATN